MILCLILICLKEINNNLKLIGKIDDSIINKNINEIKPYERNPRKNDEAVKYVIPTAYKVLEQCWDKKANWFDIYKFRYIDIKESKEILKSQGYICEGQEKTEEEKAQQIAEDIKKGELTARKQKIEMLTEKFKDDPATLAVLAKVAQALNEDDTQD